MHIEFLLEESSAEVALNELLPRFLGDRATWFFHVHRGKQDLLEKLPGRLKGYKEWIPNDWKIIVLLDQDDDDCIELKKDLERVSLHTGLNTISSPERNGQFKVINRIIIEELEAWFFGDTEAIHTAYPRVPVSINRKAKYRNPDAISGGTWEALYTILKRAGYFQSGYQKISAARAIGQKMDPARNVSHSFRVFWNSLRDIVSE